MSYGDRFNVNKGCIISPKGNTPFANIVQIADEVTVKLYDTRENKIAQYLFGRKRVIIEKFSIKDCSKLNGVREVLRKYDENNNTRHSSTYFERRILS